MVHDDLFTEEGVLVHHGGEGRGVSGLWTVIVVIHPPPRPEFSTWIDHLSRDISSLHTKNQVGDNDVRACTDRLSTKKKSIDEFHNIQLLGPSPARVWLAPLDIVSSIGNYLFGFPTQRQVDILTNAIRQSQGRIDALTHQGSDMISVMNQTRRYL